MLETDPCRENVYEHLAGKWSFRIGDYRIIYMVNEDEKTIILFDAEHRKTVYK